MATPHQSLHRFGSVTVTDFAGDMITSQDLRSALGDADNAAQQLRVVLWSWLHSDAHAPQTMARMGEVAIRFTRRLGATDIDRLEDVEPPDCGEFVIACTRGGTAPTISTQHWRRSTVRCVYRTLRTLELPVGDPTLDLRLPPRSTTAARPLTDDEMTLLRMASRTHGRSRIAAVVLALAEATATTSEIPHLRIADLDRPYEPTTVALPGARRCSPRSGHLTDWGRRILTGHLGTLDSINTSTRLVYRGAARPGSVGPQAAACNQVRHLLEAVGLDREPDLRPSSVRHWAAQKMYDEGAPLHEVAIALGSRSLDATAQAIGLDWQAGVSR